MEHPIWADSLHRRENATAIPQATKGHCTAGGEVLPLSGFLGRRALWLATLSLGVGGMGASQSIRVDGAAEGARGSAPPVRSGRPCGGRRGDAIVHHWDGGPRHRHLWPPDVGRARSSLAGLARAAPRFPLIPFGAGVVRTWLFRKRTCTGSGGRKPRACHDCGAAEDTAQHTLEVCPAWAELRRALIHVVGQDLSLPSVVNSMLGSEEAWVAVASFCEDVMSQKEAAERAREDDPLAPPLRRRRGGWEETVIRSPPPTSWW